MKSFRIFNLDLHISVIKDIKDICKQLYGDTIEITNWNQPIQESEIDEWLNHADFYLLPYMN